MKVHRWMNRIILLSIVVLFGGTFFLWNRIPEDVPGHYNGSGDITRVGDKSEIIMLLILIAVMSLILFLIDYAISLTKSSVVNTMNREYYPKETDEDRGYLKFWIRLMMELLHMEMVWMFGAIICLMALNRSLGKFFTPGIFVVFLGSIGICCFKIFRRIYQVSRRRRE